MDKSTLSKRILQKRSYLCVGLDTDLSLIPEFLRKEKDPIFEFNRLIIDATAAYCVAYKPNIAFYEALGAKGWESLQKTIEYIPQSHFTIADAKRGDIGNTSGLYAKTFFDPTSSGLDFDAVTVAPYMGYDSVSPFLKYTNKWTILLALTSNPGSADFQQLDVQGKRVYEKVLETSLTWEGSDRLMYVVGATQARELENIRRIVPEHFLLVPGVGAQGGSLEEVSRLGMNQWVGLLVNSSRSIIYAGKGKDFAELAGKEAQKIQQEMSRCLDQYYNY
ncbi:MAG: orotidine-5'-phosphate decarboxylase [Spirosomataceae bacterium]|jgi:orotidine-5'-phosphate decarboxylase